MRLHRAIASIIVLLGVSRPPAGVQAAERRCGWIENPTPGNWSLMDAQGEWIVMTQGVDEEPEGMDRMPDLTGQDWVVTSPPDHGYGCACLSVDTDAARRRVIRIASVQQLPIARCRADRTLPRP